MTLQMISNSEQRQSISICYHKVAPFLRMIALKKLNPDV